MSEYILEQIAIEVDLVMSAHCWSWCLLPYPGHPQGCPNYNKQPHCPPRVKPLTQGRYVMAASRFDLAGWKARMKRLHPEWTERQAACCLYWQPASRRALKEFIQRQGFPMWHVINLPEARGVNITAMMKRIGKPLQWPVVDSAWCVALIKK